MANPLSSNYPGGFNNGLLVRGVPITVTNPGKVFWVYNGSALQQGQRGGSDSNRGTYDSPFATLNYAMTQCTANRGDIIYVKPGHAETISTATAMAWSIAGVAIVGLGLGSSRPTFTLDTANTATIAVSAANIYVTNCLFVANFLTIAACFTLTTAKDFSFPNCEFRDSGAALNFANIVKSTGAANTVDGLYTTGATYQSIGTTFNTFVLSANDIARPTIENCVVTSINTTDLATLIICSAGVLTQVQIRNNVTVRANTTNTVALISVGGSTSSGIIQGNFCRTLDGTNNIVIVTTAGFACQGNSYSGVLSAQGFPIPALDS